MTTQKQNDAMNDCYIVDVDKDAAENKVFVTRIAIFAGIMEVLEENERTTNGTFVIDKERKRFNKKGVPIWVSGKVMDEDINILGGLQEFMRDSPKFDTVAVRIDMKMYHSALMRFNEAMLAFEFVRAALKKLARRENSVFANMLSLMATTFGEIDLELEKRDIEMEMETEMEMKMEESDAPPPPQQVGDINVGSAAPPQPQVGYFHLEGSPSYYYQRLLHVIADIQRELEYGDLYDVLLVTHQNNPYLLRKYFEQKYAALGVQPTDDDVTTRAHPYLRTTQSSSIADNIDGFNAMCENIVRNGEHFTATLQSSISNTKNISEFLERAAEIFNQKAFNDSITDMWFQDFKVSEEFFDLFLEIDEAIKELSAHHVYDMGELTIAMSDFEVNLLTRLGERQNVIRSSKIFQPQVADMFNIVDDIRKAIRGGNEPEIIASLRRGKDKLTEIRIIEGLNDLLIEILNAIDLLKRISDRDLAAFTDAMLVLEPRLRQTLVESENVIRDTRIYELKVTAVVEIGNNIRRAIEDGNKEQILASLEQGKNKIIEISRPLTVGFDTRNAPLGKYSHVQNHHNLFISLAEICAIVQERLEDVVAKVYEGYKPNGEGKVWPNTYQPRLNREDTVIRHYHVDDNNIPERSKQTFKFWYGHFSQRLRHLKDLNERFSTMNFGTTANPPIVTRMDQNNRPESYEYRFISAPAQNYYGLVSVGSATTTCITMYMASGYIPKGWLFDTDISTILGGAFAVGTALMLVTNKVKETYRLLLETARSLFDARDWAMIDPHLSMRRMGLTIGYMVITNGYTVFSMANSGDWSTLFNFMLERLCTHFLMLVYKTGAMIAAVMCKKLVEANSSFFVFKWIQRIFKIVLFVFELTGGWIASILDYAAPKIDALLSKIGIRTNLTGYKFRENYSVYTIYAILVMALHWWYAHGSNPEHAKQVVKDSSAILDLSDYASVSRENIKFVFSNAQDPKSALFNFSGINQASRLDFSKQGYLEGVGNLLAAVNIHALGLDKLINVMLGAYEWLFGVAFSATAPRDVKGYDDMVTDAYNNNVTQFEFTPQETTTNRVEGMTCERAKKFSMRGKCVDEGKDAIITFVAAQEQINEKMTFRDSSGSDVTFNFIGEGSALSIFKDRCRGPFKEALKKISSDNYNLDGENTNKLTELYLSNLFKNQPHEAFNLYRAIEGKQDITSFTSDSMIIKTLKYQNVLVNATQIVGDTANKITYTLSQLNYLPGTVGFLRQFNIKKVSLETSDRLYTLWSNLNVMEQTYKPMEVARTTTMDIIFNKLTVGTGESWDSLKTSFMGFTASLSKIIALDAFLNKSALSFFAITSDSWIGSVTAILLRCVTLGGGAGSLWFATKRIYKFFWPAEERRHGRSQAEYETGESNGRSFYADYLLRETRRKLIDKGKKPIGKEVSKLIHIHETKTDTKMDYERHFHIIVDYDTISRMAENMLFHKFTYDKLKAIIRPLNTDVEESVPYTYDIISAPEILLEGDRQIDGNTVFFKDGKVQRKHIFEVRRESHLKAVREDFFKYLLPPFKERFDKIASEYQFDYQFDKVFDVSDENWKDMLDILIIAEYYSFPIGMMGSSQI